MAKNKRLLINNLGESCEAFALNGSTASENRFLWNQNVKKIELMQLKEERQVHKVNALKSRFSKIDFNEWKKYTLPAKRSVAKANLKVRSKLYEKGIITLVSYVGEVQEEYSDKHFEKIQISFMSAANAVINKIESKQQAVTEARFTKKKNIPEGTTKQELVKAARAEVVTFETELKAIVENFVSGSVATDDTKAVDFEATGKAETFKTLSEAYKKQLKDFKVSAKAKATAYETPVKNSNILFNFETKISKDAYRLELAKQEVKSLEKLSQFNWEYKFKFDNAVELIETLPKLIAIKQKSAKELLAAKTILNDLKTSTKGVSQETIKDELKVATKEAKENLKEEAAKLKMSGAARGGLKTKKAEIKHNLKSKKRSIKLKNKVFSANAEYKFLLADLPQKIKYENKILQSNLQEIRKRTPVEVSTLRYWSSIIGGIIFPGVGSLINRQWIKATIQIIGTLFFILILAWCFGAFPSSQGNGIMGLGTFGAENGHLVNNNDSRFYLVMGSVGIIFLVAAFMYWLISGLNNINVANLSRAGVRYSNWKDQKRLLKTAGLPYLLSAPALIFILFIVVLPLLATLLLSFTNFNERVVSPTDPSKHIILNGVRYPFAWVGGQQFNYITKVVGSDFVSVLEWTVLWTIFATFLTMFLGTLLAILVNQNRIKGKTFFRIIYILPWAIPAFLTILFFAIFFGKDGTFNHAIGNAMFGRDVNWKIEVNHEKALLIFMQGWLGQSYMFLLVTGMLQSIPKSLYEAARVDGSKPLQQFRTITMPIIIMQIAPLLIGQFTFNFNNFGIIYLFNNGGPVLPGHSAGETDIFLSWVFRMVNDGVFAKPGAGAALSLIVSIFVVTPSAFIFFRSKSFRGGNF